MIHSKKSAIPFVALLFIACLVTGCAHFFYNGRFIFLMQLCTLLLLGCVYVNFMHKKDIDADGNDAFIYSLFIAIAMLAALSAVYYFAGRLQFMNIVYFSSAFLLPGVIMESWRLFIDLPSGQKQVWFYAKEIPEEPLFVYLENKPVRVKIIIDDIPPFTVLTAAPLTLPLGMAFFYILKKEDGSRHWLKQFVKEDGRPYGWVFYSTNYGLWKTYFNPEENLHRNGIRSNSLIVAKRIG